MQEDREVIAEIVGEVLEQTVDRRWVYWRSILVVVIMSWMGWISVELQKVNSMLVRTEIFIEQGQRFTLGRGLLLYELAIRYCDDEPSTCKDELKERLEKEYVFMQEESMKRK